MTTPNQQLFDQYVDRAIDVFAMAETEARILARDFAEQQDGTTLGELVALFLSNEDGAARLREIERILAIRSDALERMKDRMYRLLERLAQDEGRFVNETVGPVQNETQDNHVFTAAFIAVLINRVLQRPLNRDLGSFDDLFKELIARDRDRIERTLIGVFSYQRGSAWLSQALRKNFAETANSVHIALHAMAQHTRSVVTDLAMATVGGKVRWVSVLDGKTTAVCRSRSGKIYPADSGPRPPAHVRCRSIVAPYFEGKGDATEPTYEEWLRGQTPERVREILGQAKGSMFLEGTLSLEDMVTAKGRELTLKELATRFSK